MGEGALILTKALAKNDGDWVKNMHDQPCYTFYRSALGGQTRAQTKS